MWTFLLACGGVEDTDAGPALPAGHVIAAPLELPARFRTALPDDDSPYEADIAIDEVSRRLCQGDTALRGEWLERIRGRLAAGATPTTIGLQWGGLALGCTDPAFCDWARGLTTSGDLSPAERSIVGSLAVSCSEPADLAVVSGSLHDAVVHDDYRRVRALVAVIQWQRDPTWVREQVRADLPVARSDRVRDALAMGLSQSGDEQSRALVLDACLRHPLTEDPDEQRLFSPCGYYASLLDGPTLLPDDTDAAWVRHRSADPVAYVARHPDAAARVIGQLDTCVVDGMTGTTDTYTAERCLRALMALDRPRAALRAPSLASDGPALQRLADELTAFPTVAERNAAFAGAGLPPSTAGSVPDALAASRRLAELGDEEACRERLDKMIALLPSVQAMRWEALGPTADGWTIDAWQGDQRLRGRVPDEGGLCAAAPLAGVLNAVAARTTDRLRLGFVGGDPNEVLAIDPAAAQRAPWLHLAVPVDPQATPE